MHNSEGIFDDTKGYQMNLILGDPLRRSNYFKRLTVPTTIQHDMDS